MTDGAADRLHDTDDGLSRRQLGASVLALSGALALAPFPAGPAAAADTPTDGHAGGHGTTLRRGSPEQAGLIAGHLRQLVADAEKFLAPSPKHPWYAGAVLLAGRGGTVALHQPIGKAVRYSAYDDKTDTGVEFPADQQIAAAEDTVYDLASVSKLFTSLIAVQEIERGKLELEATVASYIPDFAGAGKQDIMIRQLLTHTSGFRAWIPLYKETTREGQLRLIWNEAPLNPPGTVYLYSDLNLISLQLVLEKLTGQTLDVLLRERITGPLGMRRTRYNPPASWKPKIAATEDARLPWSGLDRGLVWGEVHDENAFGLGGVAGHAGVFSCAWDLAILGRTLLNGGSYGKARILAEESVRLLFTDFNQAFPGDEHGLGFELYQHWYMAVRPAHGRAAWFSGMASATSATLTLPALDVTSDTASLGCDLWWDTEPHSDFLYLEVSADAGATWQPLPFTTTRKGADAEDHPKGTADGWSGRTWHRLTAALGAFKGGTIRLRWRYTTDQLYVGRGVYVDGVRVTDGRRTVFDETRPSDAGRIEAVGWSPSQD
ncbi:serine hydrolase [Streptomyces sp. NPDC055092]